MSSSEGKHGDWAEALPWIVFSYNKIHIPGTHISPFMLRTGYQPLIPADLERVEPNCKNETYNEMLRLGDMTGKLQLYTEVTREAHEQAKTAQKISYDANKFNVEFDIGDQVLWHCPVGNNHEHFSWHGPYTVSRKINEVTYEIKDNIDGELRMVSVQQVVRYLGDRVEEDEVPPEVEVDDDPPLNQLRFGMMMIFRRRRAGEGVASHLVGEIGVCDLRTKTIKIHHYIDLGSSGELKDYKPRKALKNRHLFPEYEDSNAQSYTMPRATMSLKPDSSNLVLEYPIYIS